MGLIDEKSDRPDVRRPRRPTPAPAPTPEPQEDWDDAGARRNGGERKTRLISPLTRRILAVNLIAPGLLVLGILYLDEYREGLIATELTSLSTQAEMIAAAIGEGAVVAEGGADERILPEVATPMLRRLGQTTGARVRLYGPNGWLLADSRRLSGPGGSVQVVELPPPPEAMTALNWLLVQFETVFKGLRGEQRLPAYNDKPGGHASDFPEAEAALAGDRETALRRGSPTEMILSVAVPVQRYKKVLGGLHLTRDSRAIDRALYQVRIDILKLFAVALAITVLLSVYLAGTIARPVRRLAQAADRVRHEHGRRAQFHGLVERGDEIGDLAQALNEMTEAMHARLDAIESFAADVAHEIKNPLTSLRSAVETAARIDDEQKRIRLLAIIQDDVARLDRLITDISDASRLDAELSRAEIETVDLASMLATLADVHSATRDDAGVRIRLEILDDEPKRVAGMEDRLVQVFRNLITNAITFSPADGTIRLSLRSHGDWIEVSIDDEGPGIPAGKEQRIFERFYTERAEGEKFGSHSGLGLSISRQIVEAHGGSIRASNRAGAGGEVLGARFAVRLPKAT